MKGVENMKGNKRRWRKEKAVPYLFISPFILSFLMFFVYPTFYSLYLSFHSYKGYGKMRYVGLKNYNNLIHYDTMWKCLENTFFYFIVSFILIMTISFTLALLVRTKTASRFQPIYKPMIFLPQVCAIVATSLSFKVIFGSNVGVINQLLKTNLPFLSDLTLMRWVVVVLITWRGAAWYFIIYLAGMTSINNELLEAARIDGASSIQEITHIIIPLMRPTFVLAFVTNAINSFKLYTEPNLLLAQNFDPPMQVAPYINIIMNNIYGGNFGMASAAGWLLVIIIMILTFVQLKLIGGGENA